MSQGEWCQFISFLFGVCVLSDQSQMDLDLSKTLETVFEDPAVTCLKKSNVT